MSLPENVLNKLQDPKFLQGLKDTPPEEFIGKLDGFPDSVRFQIVTQYATNDQIRGIYNVSKDMDDKKGCKKLIFYLNKKRRKVRGVNLII